MENIPNKIDHMIEIMTTISGLLEQIVKHNIDVAADPIHSIAQSLRQLVDKEQ